MDLLRPNIFGGKKKGKPPGGQVSGCTRRTCMQNLTVYLSKTAWSFVRKRVPLRTYLELLGLSVGSSFWVKFYLILNIGKSDLQMFAWNVLQPCLGVPAVASFTKKNKSPTEAPDNFWPFRWPVVGGDTFSPLAPILGPEKKVAMPPSSTVHGVQYDTKYLVCNIRIDGASGVRGKGNLRRLSWTS